jgi:KipI family sensor histidine kinase inhibitor
MKNPRMLRDFRLEPDCRKLSSLDARMHLKPKILLCGDTAVSVEFGDRIDPGINALVRRLYALLKAGGHPGITDLNPAYRSLFIQYDPWVCSFERLAGIIEMSLPLLDAAVEERAQVKDVPVCYGGLFGPDLEEIAALHGLCADEIIRLHCAPVYLVYMIGFTPGFAYLGGLDERLHTPRKREPRIRVAAGSVGIADQQTGIYAIESPGGWWLIGRTPLKLFDPGREPPSLIEAGDFVRFRPIAGDEFEKHSNP